MVVYTRVEGQDWEQKMSDKSKTVGILGGTGPAGRGFAVRLAEAGYSTVIGSRSVERGEEIVAEVLASWPDRELPLTGGDNEKAASCDIVVVATPWEGAKATVAALREVIEGSGTASEPKIVLSMCNALVRIDGEFQPLILPRGSIAESIQAALPGAKVAATMHHVPAKELGMLDEPVDCDVLICADDATAAAVAAELVEAVPGLRPLYVGGLSCAAPVEAFTPVLLQLNVLNKTRVGLRFTGLPE